MQTEEENDWNRVRVCEEEEVICIQEHFRVRGQWEKIEVINKN